MPYPLIGCVTDFFVVDKLTIKKFSHLCGVFAILRLHVEIAIPTSLVLTSKQLTSRVDLTLNPIYLWNEEREKFEKKYENNLSKLINKFPEDYLFVHPVKLSNWKVK